MCHVPHRRRGVCVTLLRKALHRLRAASCFLLITYRPNTVCRKPRHPTNRNVERDLPRVAPAGRMSLPRLYPRGDTTRRQSIWLIVIEARRPLSWDESLVSATHLSRWPIFYLSVFWLRLSHGLCSMHRFRALPICCFLSMNWGSSPPGMTFHHFLNGIDSVHVSRRFVRLSYVAFSYISSWLRDYSLADLAVDQFQQSCL